MPLRSAFGFHLAAVGFALSLAASSAGPGEALAQTADWQAKAEAKERALALHDEAKELYLMGRYRDALDKLRAAVEFDPEGKLLYYNLGLLSEKTGDLQGAQRYYQKLLTLEWDPEQQERVRRDLQRVRGAMRHRSWAPQGEPMPARPAPAARPAQPHGVSSATTTWLYVAGATAGVCLLAGGILAIHAVSLAPGSNDATGPGGSVDELRDDAQQAHASAVAADVLFAVGALAGVATITLALAADSTDDESTPDRSAPPTVSLQLAPTTWRLAGKF